MSRDGRALMNDVARSTWVCSVDLGTTHIKAGLFDAEGRSAGIESLPARAVGADGVSYDAEEQVGTAWRAIADVLRASGLPPAAAAAALMAAQ